MKRSKSYISVGMSILLMILTIVFCVFAFQTINQVFFDASVKQNMETIEVIRDLGIHTVEDAFENLEEDLEKSVLEYTKMNQDGLDKIAAISKLALPEDGINYWLAEANGNAVDSQGSTFSWKEELNLAGVFETGKLLIIDPYFNKDGDYIFGVAAPVRENNQITSVLIVRMDGFCVSHWLEDIRFHTGEGVAYIVNSEGRNIAASREENYDWITTQYNSQELAKTDKESKTVADLERLALDGKTGRGSYIWEGSRNYLVYAPVPTTGWGFYVGFYGAEMNNYIKESAKATILTSIPFLSIILLFFILLIVYVNYNLRKEKRYVKELLVQKQEIQKQAEDLSVNEERFRVAMEQTNNIIFEYDLQTGDITNYYASSVKHISSSVKDVKDQIIANGTLDDESIERLQKMFDDIRNGEANHTCVIRVYYADEQSEWYKVSVSPQSDQQTRIIGIIVNITKEKLGEQDPLTGLLNKKVLSEQIDINLKDVKQACAFMIFDIDNFKHINDTLGHPVGDKVIIHTAHILKMMFDADVLIGRIGGDEFGVFWYRNYSTERLKDILDQFYEHSIITEEKMHITYSCGVVISSRTDIRFEELYKNTDVALYEAKNQGKNQYCIKGDDISQEL